LGGKTQEIFNFITVIDEDDLVLAADGQRVLGVSRVVGGYEYEPEAEAPHRRPVEWLTFEEWELPATTGQGTTVHRIRGNDQNLVATEKQLLEAPETPPPLPKRSTRPRQPLRLEDIPKQIQAILARKGQVILYGPPGTGKTYWARKTALDLAAHAAFGERYAELEDSQKAKVSGDQTQQGLVRVVTFHPAYGYEDFIEGYRPQETDGRLAFTLREGVFKRLCADAAQEPKQKFYLLIDEINRGDIPRIFGELLTLLENDKRGQPVSLPLSDRRFTVPENVYLIGTMNTADRSIALLDTALRRRFGFIELMPDTSVFGDAVAGNAIPLGPWLAALNRRILEHIGRDARNLQIGHAYLLEDEQPVTDVSRFVRIVEEDIVPLLQEYCYEDYTALARILGSRLVDEDRQRVRHELFASSRREEIIQALLALAPDIATSIEAVSKLEPEATPDELDEEEDELDA
jgi:5-methylcytosine-specific restriction protein B